MTIVYTPLRAWVSHWETPERSRRQAEVTAFFEEGTFLDRWRALPLLFVFEKEKQARGQVWLSGKPAYQSRSFAVFRHCAVGVSCE